VNAIKSVLHRIFAPQKRVTESKRTLLLAAGIYFLLLVWAIVFKFSAISEINMDPKMSLGDRFLRGLRFFDFFLESNPWRLVRGFLIAILNVLLFCPWGIYASFFYDQTRAVGFACAFSCMVECLQLFARFGVFSFEDMLLNTLGAFLGVLLFKRYINRIPENTAQKINLWTVRIGAPVAALAYVNVIVAMALYFS
jgi:glycopeptide antibiotics resistance protein